MRHGYQDEKKGKTKFTFKLLAQEASPNLPLILLIANKILNIIGFVDFINRMVEWDHKQWTVTPGNLAGQVTRQAYQNDSWTDIGKIGSGKRACTYQVQEYTRAIEGNEFRLIVVKSSARQERYEHRLQKQQGELQKDLDGLAKKTFACEADARKEWERFAKEHKQRLHCIEVQYQKTRTEKRPRGNPGKNPKPPQVKVTWQVCGQITGVEEERAARVRQGEESFVLITNVASDELSNEQVLRQYKDQTVVEVQFRLLKESAIASAIFLKAPGRIDALMLLLLSLSVAQEAYLRCPT